MCVDKFFRYVWSLDFIAHVVWVVKVFTTVLNMFGYGAWSRRWYVGWTFSNLRTLKSLPRAGIGCSRFLECLEWGQNSPCNSGSNRFSLGINLMSIGSNFVRFEPRLSGSNPTRKVRTQHCYDQTCSIPAPWFVSFWVLGQVLGLGESSNIKSD